MRSVLEAKRLELRAERAADLMMPNPISLDVNSTLHEALVLFTEKGFTAAPVIDNAGQPVGVISRYDIVVHDREQTEYLPAQSEFYSPRELATAEGETLRGFQVERVDRTCVGDVMTPGVLSVAPDTPAEKVLEEMLALKVHRLFVVDRTGVLVGVISALDFLKHLGTAS
jgi:CBS domain-containing protein